MHPLSQLLLLSLAASPSYSRPVDASLADDTIPVLFLPPSVGKHPNSSQPPIVPLVHSDPDPGPTSTPTSDQHRIAAPTPVSVSPTAAQATTLSVAVAPHTETIHVAETKFMTITVTVQAQPTSTSASASPPTHAPEPDSNTESGKPFMATYFPDWTGDQFPPEKVDFSRFNWIDFGKFQTPFAVPDANRQLKFTSDDSEDLLNRLVSAAHQHGSKVKLSVGGWTGSRYFSDAVSNDANRHEFVKNIVSAYHKFNIDGIDIDWEYPGVQGAGDNKVSPQDSAHFLSFLQLLRSQLPEDAKLTAATQVTPFAGPDGKPMEDVSEFAKVFDWILIMNYDIWGASPTPGPNAPLRDGCHNSTQPDASASASVAAWTNAGFAPNQITLGLPSYGYVQTSTARRLTQRRQGGTIRRGKGARFAKLRVRQDEDDEDDDSSVDAAGAGGTVRVTGEGEGDDGGQVQFNQLIKEGALKLSSSGSYVGSGGFSRMWDVCSSTPYLVSNNAKQVVAYDDPQSLGMKAAFARGAGLRGVNMFDVHGDTEGWTLTDAIREGLGL